MTSPRFKSAAASASSRRSSDDRAAIIERDDDLVIVVADGVLVAEADGLFCQVNAHDVIAACGGGSVDIVVQRLVERARLPSGRYADDVAVVVVAPS